MNSDRVKESTNRLNDRLYENEILRKQNNQNKDIQVEKNLIWKIFLMKILI